jgi:hypothetical protein
MMNSFGDILSKNSFNSPVMKTVQATVVVEVGNEALVHFFGKPILEYAQIGYIKNNTLAIACLSSMAAQEIRMKEKEILAFIKAKVPAVKIDKIRYLS